jgi:signal transduction histidine kinase
MQMHLTLGMCLVSFILVVAVFLATSRMVQDRFALLGQVDACAEGIRRARLSEANSSRSETDIGGAIKNLSSARGILLERQAELEEFSGENSIAAIVTLIEDYEAHIRKPLAGGDAEMATLGRESVSVVEELERAVRESADGALVFSRRAQIGSLFVFFALVASGVLSVGWRVLAPLDGISSRSKRIARADYSLFVPPFRFRDEFSDLSSAVNGMIAGLEQRQEMLVQAHKLSAIGTLTAGVAHELNNPINNISLTAHMLLEDFEDLNDEEQIDMIGDLISEVDRTKKIVHNLLDFTRENEDKMEPLDLGDVVKKTLAVVGNQISIAGIQTDVKIMPDLPKAHGDTQRLEQMVLNLILNAVDVTPEGGRIQILVIPDDEPNSVVIKVTDYGPGVPEDALQSIFDPFFSTKPNGVGLGLFICREISVKHGGHISVETKAGAGSSFLAHLPATVCPVDLQQVEPA